MKLGNSGVTVTDCGEDPLYTMKQCWGSGEDNTPNRTSSRLLLRQLLTGIVIAISPVQVRAPEGLAVKVVSGWDGRECFAVSCGYGFQKL